MNKTNSNLSIRTLSGIVLLIVVLGSVLLSQWSFAALIAVIVWGSLREFFILADSQGASSQRCYATIIGVGIVIANFLIARGDIALTWLVALLPLFMLVFIIELYRKSEDPIKNIATTFTAILYAAVPLSLLSYIAIAPGQEYRPWVILSYIFIVWANDVGAYLVGMSIGKRKLFERISPKKSWEGFFGGLITSCAVATLAGWLQDGDLIVWCVLGAIVSVSGVFGDLVESMFKRAAKVKDSGNIIPGHGGFLDRFDALILSAPFIFVYFIIFTP